MAIPFICWRPLCSATVLRAPLTGPPTGCAWAKPRAGLGRTDPTELGIKPLLRTFTFIPCIGVFANAYRATSLNPVQPTYDHHDSLHQHHRSTLTPSSPSADP